MWCTHTCTQLDMNVENDLEVLTDYFNLGISLTELTKEWAAKDEHYAFVNTRLQVSCSPEYDILNYIAAFCTICASSQCRDAYVQRKYCHSNIHRRNTSELR